MTNPITPSKEKECFSEKLIYTVPSRLPEEIIDSMVNQIESLTYKKASLAYNREVDSTTRRSEVAWMAWDEWIPGIIHNMMYSANKEYFHYDIDYFDSRIQSTIYNGKNKDYYNWHIDTAGHMRKIEGMERKLSCSFLLSDPNEYEGGEFQMHYFNGVHQSLKVEKGTAIIFPAWLPHRVRPVTKGKRISLVAWMEGPMFR